MDLSLYETVASTGGGVAYLSPDNETLVVRHSDLGNAKGTRELMAESAGVLDRARVQTLVTDASTAERATFDAMWHLEEAIWRLGTLESLKEWRFVPSSSPALQIALRRLLRLAQSQSVFCSVYLSFPLAMSEQNGCLIDSQTRLLNSPTGVVVRTGQYVLAELRGKVPDVLLDVHMDALSYALQDGSPQRLILRLFPGLQVDTSRITSHLSKILGLGGQVCLVVADEAHLFRDECACTGDSGICHLTRDMATAEASLALISLDRFRSPGRLGKTMAVR